MTLLHDFWLSVVASLGSATVSNGIIIMLGLLALALLAALWMALDLNPEMLLAKVRRRSRTGRGRLMRANRFTERMLTQVEMLRGSDESLRATVQSRLFRDGNPTAPIEAVGNDFFQFLQVVVGLSLASLAAFVVIAVNAPVYFMGLAIIGYLAPSFMANRYNAARRKRIMAQMPEALMRMQTRAATPSPTLDLRRIFSQVGGVREGPLFEELTWAANQMVANTADQYEILRRIDLRNQLDVFSILADQLEREESAKGKRTAFDAFIESQLQEYTSVREQNLEKVTGRVTAVMTPFLFIALILAVLSSFVIKLLAGG